MRQLISSLLTTLIFILAFISIVNNNSNRNAEHITVKNQQTSGALQALDFWTQSRAYPEADIPRDKYYKAFSYAKQHLKESTSLRQIGTTSLWQAIGPLNWPGRFISVAVNPQNPYTLYAGSASGGLWRSFTRGEGGDWHRITTGFPVLGVMAIAIQPNDSNVIYIGTGETYRYQGTHGGVAVRTTRGSYGMGILKTTDGGTTWTKSLDWSYNQERGVQAIRINPLNYNTIIAATTEGIYKSNDAGNSWTQTLNVIMAEDIVIHTQDTNLVMASCGNFASPDAGIYLSLDGGTEWFRIDGGLPSFSGKTMLGMHGADPDIVYASVADSTTGAGSLWKTGDFGSSWMRVSNSGPFGVQGWYSHFVAVHPTDPNQILHAGVWTIKSTDGGLTFRSAGSTYADHHNYAHDPSDPNVLYVVNDGGIARSVDFGDIFYEVSIGIQTAQFYSGFSCSATDSLLGLGQTQDHIPGWRYTGSLNWSESGADECGWTAIDQTNDSIMYAATRSGGSIVKSTNRGRWFSSSWGFSGFGSWNSPFVIAPANTNILYFGKNFIYKTTDQSNTWFATNTNLTLDGNPALSMGISHTNPDTVYVGTAPVFTRSHIFRTTDGGNTWTNITGTLPDRYPMDIAVDPNDSRVVYVAFGGYNAGHLFKSTDAGTTWTDVTGVLPDVHATAIVVDPLNSNHVYAGNDIGVYVSTDGGATWQSFSEGLPEAVLVSDLVLSPSNRVIRAATHGNGVFERKMLSPVTSVTEESSLPKTFMLYQNYPNPFNPSTVIRYQLSVNSHVTLRVYDILGRAVATLVNERKAAGSYEVEFDARDLPSGIYAYTLTMSGKSLSKKMLLLK
ncbi:MAG: T9SS type A sorting domain-containing protein [Ignavibacteriae bacterium]|nr:T9SS type A sorting domain-containing protein [Ignavibacteriota bacterium]